MTCSPGIPSTIPLLNSCNLLCPSATHRGRDWSSVRSRLSTNRFASNALASFGKARTSFVISSMLNGINKSLCLIESCFKAEIASRSWLFPGQVIVCPRRIQRGGFGEACSRISDGDEYHSTGALIAPVEDKAGKSGTLKFLHLFSALLKLKHGFHFDTLSPSVGSCGLRVRRCGWKKRTWEKRVWRRFLEIPQMVDISGFWWFPPESVAWESRCWFWECCRCGRDPRRYGRFLY